MPLVFAGFTPHPPLLIEGIGDEEKIEVVSTHRAYQKFAELLVAAAPTTVVVVSPHGPVFSDAYTIAGWDTLEGDFTPFGSTVSMTWSSDRDYAQRAEEMAEAQDLPLVTITSRQLTSHRHGTELDHGTMVPLWYLQAAGWDGKVVCVRIGGLPPAQCYEVGRVLAQAAGATKIAIIASGDLSHCLTDLAPSPYNPAGAEFDQAIVDALRQGNYESVLAIPPDLRQRAAECGWRPLVTLLGGLDHRSSDCDMLSYEGPFGVGYMVAAFQPGPQGSGAHRPFPQSRPTDASPHSRLAREAIRYYLLTGNHLELPVEPALDKRAGVFVSLKLDDQLRGCIGTIEAEHSNLTEEIIANAVSAASEDPRFEPITADELDQLSISIDVLGEPVPASFNQLDPAIKGLVAEWKGRRGLLLPDLPGVDSPKEQLEIVCTKAGIPVSAAQEAKLFTFAVERFH